MPYRIKTAVAAAVAALLLTALLAGCRRLPSEAATADTTAAADTSGGRPPAPPSRRYSVATLGGEVNGISLSGQLRVAHDSMIWVSVGRLIEVGRGMCTPDSLWLRSSLLGRDDAVDYATLRRTTGVDISYDELQEAALADDGGERLTRMAQRLGLDATVSVAPLRQVDRLSFPFPKPTKP